MNTNTLTPTVTRSAASRWVSPVCTPEQYGIAPKVTRQGSAMSFASPKHAATTLAAVRQDAAGRVPPRGRPV
ncbi:MAG: hypothetical protein JWM02_2356 [Frankiales bacterium]|nr:hypothetical protein [Frankiales bacterium]